MNMQMPHHTPKYRIKRLMAILPLVALALFALLGNTYRYHMMPKVQAGTLSHGAFPVTLPLQKARITSDKAVSMMLPGALDGKVSAAAMPVRQGEMVTKGQTLLSYHKQQIDRLLMQSQIAVIEAQEALYQFDMGFAQASALSEKALEDAAKALESAKQQKDDTQIPELQKRLDQRKHELELLTKSGYFMGTTRQALQWHLDDAMQEQEALRLIAENNYTLSAPLNGYVLHCAAVPDGTALKARNVLYTILPNNAAYQMEVPLPDDVKIQTPPLNSPLILSDAGDSSIKLTVTFMGIQKKHLIFYPSWEDLTALTYPDTYQLHLSSPFYPFLAPKELFDQDGMIYLLEPTSRERIYTVSKIAVETDEGNEQYIPLRGGFPEDALFVLYPDRTLRHGTQVFLLPN